MTKNTKMTKNTEIAKMTKIIKNVRNDNKNKIIIPRNAEVNYVDYYRILSFISNITSSIQLTSGC